MNLKEKIARGWEILQALLEHNWALWMCALILFIVYLVCRFTVIQSGALEDGLLGGFIALLFTEGVRAALKSLAEYRREHN